MYETFTVGGKQSEHASEEEAVSHARTVLLFEWRHAGVKGPDGSVRWSSVWEGNF